ncbi:MAG: CPBP family intramembrane metalloprotease [Bacteroidales bacterium]|nr:CPBP family intramembrane metalloprotease [Bacteroidales bacterium]
MKKLVASPFSQLGLLLLIFVLGMILSSGLAFFLPMDSYALQVVSQLLSFLLPTIVVSILYWERPWSDYQLAKGRWFIPLLAIIGMLLLVPLSDSLTHWNNEWHWSGGFEQIERILRNITEASEELMKSWLVQIGWGNFVVNLLVMALLPAICEEVFFRGGIQKILTSWTSKPWVSIIVTAAIFSLAHGDLFAFVPRFMMGIVLGAFYYYSGSLIVSMAAHFANNALIVILYSLYSNGLVQTNYAEDLALGWPLSVLSTVGFVLVFVLFLRFSRVKNC